MAQRAPCTLYGESADFELLLSEPVQDELRACGTALIRFEGLVLADRDLSGLYAPNMRVDRATWTSVVLRNANLVDIGLRGPGVVLRDVDLRGAALGNAFLDQVMLERVDFAGATLSDGHFGEVAATNVSFANAHMPSLRWTNQEEVAVAETRFDGAKLTGATLSMAARQVSFDGADLTGAQVWLKPPATASFEGAILVNAQFLFTSLDRITLSNADVRGADFSNTSGSPADCSSMRWDGNTKIPEGVTMESWCPSAPGAAH